MAKAKHRGNSVSEKKQLAVWKADFPWLKVEGLGIDVRLKCTIWTERNVVSVWARGGSCNTQRVTIVKHNRSAEHKEHRQTDKGTVERHKN